MNVTRRRLFSLAGALGAVTVLGAWRHAPPPPVVTSIDDEAGNALDDEAGNALQTEG